jgi:hypothetical protein
LRTNRSGGGTGSTLTQPHIFCEWLGEAFPEFGVTIIKQIGAQSHQQPALCFASVGDVMTVEGSNPLIGTTQTLCLVLAE